MSTVQKGKGPVRINRLGGLLVGISVVAVVIAYPPPTTGLNPLLGVGNVFLPLIASVASLLFAIIGGALLSRGFSETQPERTHRLLVRILVPIGPVALISAYLVTVAGFGPQSPFITIAVILAIVGGVADEFIG